MFYRQVVIETLSVGATMLLPPLRERMELLHSLLPQGPDRWESLSKGQVPHGSTAFLPDNYWPEFEKAFLFFFNSFDRV